MTVQPETAAFADKTGSRGRFIVFEGIDGSGKSTQISLLAQSLRKAGINAVCTCEPTDTGLGGMIRDALSGAFPRDPYELASMFLADRISHNVSPIYGVKKLLDGGAFVICDRYYYSSFAYQGMDADLDWVMDINLNCAEIARPDLCLFLDIDPLTGKKRMEGTRAFTEIFENTASLERIRSRFFDVFSLLSERENIKIIDAGRAVEEVARDVVSAVKESFDIRF